ncbi:hypothetical protein SDC9_97223 [bioreactor metagenome]|uniref:Uncharacterized protein n=1 Tax=bioreactor metagenome TaxID=1076179 RepID=A0A645ABB8_9ZZZZ
MAGAGLGGHGFGTSDLVVKSLWNGCVGFVAARRGDAFIFIVNVRRGTQSFFQSARTDQRGGSPQFVGFAHLIGDGNITFSAHFLFDKTHGEQY